METTLPPEDDTTIQEAPTDVRSLLDAAVAEQETTVEQPGQTEGQRETRARGADGKFARAEPAADATPPTAKEPPAAPVAEPGVETKPPVIAEPPAAWSEAHKATFRKLDPEGQKFLLDRQAEMQADYSRKTGAVAALERDYRPVAEMFAPHENDLRAKGYTPASLIKAWMGAELQLANPAQAPAMIKTLVENYKMDRGAVARALGLAAPAAGVVVPPPTNDNVTVLPPEVAAKFDTFDQFIAQQTRQQGEQLAREQRETTNRVMSTIDQFRDAKDDKGALLHPHFAEVEDRMTAFALAARTRGEAIPPLDELYDQAVWATPATRAKQLEATSAADEARRTAAEAERQKQIRAKAVEARRAGSSVTGSPGADQTSTRQGLRPSGSVRDQLLAAVEDAETA
jgi:hypothetical protein